MFRIQHGSKSTRSAPGRARFALLCLALAGCTSGSGGSDLGSDASGGLTVDSQGNGVFNIVGPEGGPFPVGEREYVLTNRSQRPVRWLISASEPWLLVISGNDGTLQPMESAQVRISIKHSVANSLPRGEYPSDIYFRDAAGDSEVVHAFQLTVVAADAARMVVTPDTPFTPHGSVGSPVTPAQWHYTIENAGGQVMAWTATSTEQWLELPGPTSGMLAAGETVDVPAVVDNSMVQSFGAGEYSALVTFTNDTNDEGSTQRDVILTVLDQPGDSERVTDGLAALYDFEEPTGDMVRDVSGVGQSLDLRIQDMSRATRMPGVLSFEAPTLVTSSQYASKIVDRCKASNEISIEAWMRPKNVTQDGPARVVTMSRGSSERNFTLGQGLWGGQPSDLFDVRLRTTNTDDAGMPSVITPAGSARVDLMHVVYTRNSSGNAKVYVDGNQVVQANVSGSFANWRTDFELTLGNEVGTSRPWLGDLHLVAIYSRALSGAEVDQNFAAGTGDAQSGHLSVTPAGGMSISGIEGGDFSPLSKTYTVKNAGTASIEWTAYASEPWIIVDVPSNTFLDPDGDESELEVVIDSQMVNTFSAGTYTGTVQFTNLTNGYGSTTREVVLTVNSEDSSDDDGSKPGPSNTGPSNPSILQPSGSLHITQNGAVIENVNVSGTIEINANNVTIRNFRINGGGTAYGVFTQTGSVSGTVLEDGEITNCVNGVYGHNFEARRLNIHHLDGDGLKARSNVLIENCWVHHLGMDTSNHADGVQTRLGNHLVIRNNYFDVPVSTSPNGNPGHVSNSAIFISTALGPIDDVLVKGNWLNGGNATVYMIDKGVGYGPPTNARLLDNRFGRDYRYTPLSAASIVSVSGNVWDDTGQLMDIND